MAITKHTRDFIENLIDYYISEASSYKQIAESFKPHLSSIEDSAFGIIVGCIYSAFLRAYENENKQVELDDMQEFNQIINHKANLIKKALGGTNPE